MDNNNNLLLKENYAYIEYYRDNYFIVTKNGYTGIINANGSIIVPIEYSTISKIDKTEILEATKIKNNQIEDKQAIKNYFQIIKYMHTHKMVSGDL